MTGSPDVLSLTIGSEVRYRNRPYVIHRIEADTVAATLINIATGELIEAAISDLSPIHPTQPPERPDLSTIPEEQLAEAWRKYEIIRPLLELPNRSRTDVEAAAQTHGLATSTLYVWLKAFQQTGHVSVFLRKPRHDKGQMGMSKEVEEAMTTTIRLHYLNKQKKQPAKVIREVLALCKKLGLVPPHPNTIRNRIKHLSDFEKTKAREGLKKARRNHFLSKGKFPGADFPLAVVQVDHTLVDLILVDDLHRLPIGRPWLTLLIDVFSRMVLGFYISFDPPGDLSLGLCLSHAFLPKETWLAKHGIESEWPCWGLPRTIHADNAKEFRGKMLSTACREYGIDLEWRPVATPHYGAHIERLLGTLNSEIHALPGTTFSNPQKRGDYDSAAHSVMTLQEFERWFAILCVEAYHQRRHSELGCSPLARWQEGIQGSDERPGIGPPPPILDETHLKLDLMPSEERTVQQYGIVWDNVEYLSDVLRPWINAPDPDNPRLKRKFLCRRDPRDISVIWFYDPEVQQYYAIPYRNTAHPAISIWELRQAQKRAEQERSDIPIDEDRIFAAYEEMREIEEAAKKTTKTARRNSQRKRLGLDNARAHVKREDSTLPSKESASPTQRRELRPFTDVDDMQDE